MCLCSPFSSLSPQQSAVGGVAELSVWASSFSTPGRFFLSTLTQFLVGSCSQRRVACHFAFLGVCALSGAGSDVLGEPPLHTHEQQSRPSGLCTLGGLYGELHPPDPSPLGSSFVGQAAMQASALLIEKPTGICRPRMCHSPEQSNPHRAVRKCRSGSMGSGLPEISKKIQFLILGQKSFHLEYLMCSSR